MKVAVHSSIAAIDTLEWNQLNGDKTPFLRHEFLLAAEQSGCVSAASGWQPCHLTIASSDGIRAAMPLYEKAHSWGEFVFDWSWANAYAQAGLDYYPKLVSAAPFTPAPSRRLLCDPDDMDAANALLKAAIQLATDRELSSLHILFPHPDELDIFEQNGFLLRKDCQFHWHNQGYANFDEFLATFSSAKRKKARRDRRKVREAGISFRRLRGKDIQASDWTEIYALISRPFLARGNAPYFSEDFFRTISTTMPDNLLAIVALQGDRKIAAAVFFESVDALYGRYWGSDGDYDALHFETCYYQGIDYCIEHKKQLFEPGTQGEHKISRGFSPVETYSAHWLSHPQFSDAIGSYLNEEGRHIARYIEAVEAHTPYKSQESKSSDSES